jgi:uncharacterized membrane protein
MDHLPFAVTFLCAMGCGLVGGLFFAFSAFVMAALARVSPPSAFRPCNRSTSPCSIPYSSPPSSARRLCAVTLVVALLRWGQSGAGYLLAGSLLYLAATIFVTMAFNVPLNNRLGRANPDSAEGAQLWTRYLSSWTAWNHVRTIASLAAAACFIVALVRFSG